MSLSVGESLIDNVNKSAASGLCQCILLMSQQNGVNMLYLKR